MLPAARTKKLTGVSGTKLAPVRSRSASNGWASDMTAPRPIGTSTALNTNANTGTTSTQFLRAQALELGRRLASGSPWVGRLCYRRRALRTFLRIGGAYDLQSLFRAEGYRCRGCADGCDGPRLSKLPEGTLPLDQYPRGVGDHAAQ